MACSEYEGLGISTLTSSGPWWSPGSKGLLWPSVLLALPFTLQSCHQHKVVFFFLLRISFLPEGSPSMHVACLPPGWNQTSIQSFTGPRNFLMLGLNMRSLLAGGLTMHSAAGRALGPCSRHAGRAQLWKSSSCRNGVCFSSPHTQCVFLPPSCERKNSEVALKCPL